MRALFCFLALLICAGSAQAASISIANSGFETDVLADGDATIGPTSITGWSVFGGVGFGGGVFNPTTSAFSAEAPEGDNVGWLVSFNTAWIGQTLTTTYQAGETYTLSALVGDADDKNLQFFNIGLYSNSIEVTTNATPVPADDGFTLVTASFVADASLDGKAIEIRLGAFAGNLTDDPDSADVGNVFFDNVQLTTSAAVPVPAGAWLFGSALGLLGWMRRRTWESFST